MSTTRSLIPDEQQESAVPAELSPKTQILGDQFKAVDELRRHVAMYREALAESDEIERAMIVADGLLKIRQRLEPFWPMIQRLMGSPMGFQTDKDKDGPAYDKNTVLDCCCCALLNGAHFVNRQFTIISGRPYYGQTFMRAAVDNFPGLQGFDDEYAVVENKAGTAKVFARAKWTLKGVPNELRYDGKVRPLIPVRVNAGMGDEAIIGKTKRKLYAKIFEKLTGQVLLTVDERGQADPSDDDGGGLTALEDRSEPDGAEPERPTAEVAEFFSLDEVNRCTTITQVNEYQKACAQRVGQAGLGPDAQKMVMGAIAAGCDAKRDEIRGGRGERSNR